MTAPAADVQALLLAGLRAERAGHADRAEACYRAAARRQPRAAAPWLAAGALWAAGGDLRRAIEAFRHARRLAPGLARVHADLGLLLRREGELGAAIESFEAALRAAPGDRSHAHRLAAALHEARELVRAVALYGRLLADDARDGQAHYNLGVTLPLLGRHEAALRHLRRALALDPGSGNAHVRVGRLRGRGGRVAAAAQSFRLATLASPGDAEGWTERALYEARLDGRDACGALLRALALSPDHVTVWHAASRWCEARGAIDRAVGLLEQACRMAAKPAGFAEALVMLLLRHGRAEAAETSGERFGHRYAAWRAWEAKTREERAVALAGRVAVLSEPPRFSVLVPVHDPPPGFLDEAIASVRAQSYPHWQLCLVDDGSRDREIAAMLRSRADEDARIHLTVRPESGHVSVATNAALDRADGSHVAFLDHDDRLAADALAEMAVVFATTPGAVAAYSDEDKIDEDGRRHSAFFKTDWDPDLILSQNYVCHLFCARRDAVDAAGRLRTGVEGSQDHDLVLRLAQRSGAGSIVHVPRVLYHWRSHAGSTAGDAAAKAYAHPAMVRAVEDHLAGTGARVETDGEALRVVWPLPDPAPRVGVVIPTRDRLPLLRRCIDGLVARTDYPSLDIVVMDNGSRGADTLAYLDGLRRDGIARVIRSDGPFDFSALSNAGAAAVRGDVLCFLNNDVEPLEPGWLDEMVRQAMRPDVGVVGAKLCYPDRTVQHGGAFLAGRLCARHLHVGLGLEEAGYFGRAARAQTLSAVTGACMVVRRAVHDSVGGFDAAALAIDLSDMDYCLRVADAGWRTVWTPFARLVHHESATRGTFVTAAKEAQLIRERDRFLTRWGERLSRDPYYNVNLTLDEEPFMIAVPPGDERPAAWRP